MTGPNVSVSNPMGEGGLRLHEWILTDQPSDADARVSRDAASSVGAVIIGRRMFDVGVGVWDDTPFPVPTFVLTHEAREPLSMTSGTFTFVNDGIERALEQASAVAGDKHVRLMSGTVARQALDKGLVDEIHIQVAPILLGRGQRLFDCLQHGNVELEPVEVVASPRVTHLHYRVVK
jgi:dihydrofolate reductase